MPKLPFDEIDLLIVDFMGKDVSGAGMDPNVIGRSVYGYSSSLLPSKEVLRVSVQDSVASADRYELAVCNRCWFCFGAQTL